MNGNPIGVCYPIFKLVSNALRRIEKRGDVGLFSLIIIFVLIFVLIMATLSDALQVGYLIGAIVSGFLLQLSMKRLRKNDEEERQDWTMVGAKNLRSVLAIKLCMLFARD